MKTLPSTNSVFLRCFFVIVFLLTISAVARGTALAEEKITIAAAADLSFAIKEIAANFEKETGTKAVISFGSTGMFDKQIREGAPFDIFFSADVNYIDKLMKDGFIASGTVELYAQGRIVLAANKATGTKTSSLKDLLKPEIKHIAIANPVHAPYGKAAMEALKSAGLWESVKSKLVYGENIRQTLQYIQSGDAQAGIVALSIADVPEITYMTISDSLYTPIKQAVGIVKVTKELSASKDFIRYLNGKKGRAVMKKHGFLLPGEF